MAIGTSLGTYYEDEFQHASATAHFPPSDDNIINPETNNQWGQSPSPLTDDKNNLNPFNMQNQMNDVKDPRVIYDDTGNIVDYDLSQQK